MAVDLTKKIPNLNFAIGDTIQSRTGDRKKQYKEYQEEYGATERRKSLENVRKSILDSERAMTKLPSNVKSRTAGRNMTQGQYDRLLAKESEGISGTLGDLARSEESSRIGLDEIMSEVGTMMGMDEQNFRDVLDELSARRGKSWDEDTKAWQAKQNSLNRAASKAAQSYDYTYLQNLLKNLRSTNAPGAFNPPRTGMADMMKSSTGDAGAGMSVGTMSAADLFRKAIVGR